MFDRIKTRLSSDEGFTLIELLVVIVILGILVAIAVPSYLSLRGNAQQAAAQSNVRSAIPAAEEYYQQQSPTSYTGMKQSTLATIAPGISPHILAAVNATNDGYCLVDTEDGGTNYAWYSGGAGGTSAVTYGTKAAAATACPKATYSSGDSGNASWPG